MATQVEICNIALSQLGANLINSLDERGTEQTLIKAFWDTARVSLLNTHPWNFAIKRVELARDLGIPTYEFKYQFTLPPDCLRVLQVYRDGDYRLEGRKIITNSTTCLIKYVGDITDTSIWSASFVAAMAARVRFDLAYPITKDSNQVAIAKSLLDSQLQQSRQIDGSEDYSDPLGQFASALVAVRGS